MSLELWKSNNWLRETKPTRTEIAKLFAVVDREIKDASIHELSIDGRFMHAYDAALNLCTIALRASGYEVTKGHGHHKRTIEALPHCMGKEFSVLADRIEIASRQRGQAMYDRTDVVQEEDASDLLQAAVQLRESVIEWIKRTNPSIVPHGM